MNPTFSRRAALAGGAGGALSVLTMGALTMPSRPSLGEVSGDTALAEAVKPYLAGHRKVAITLIEADGSVRHAFFGAQQNTDFELASVTKTFTGNLLQLAIDNGELELQTTVADVLGDRARGSAIADVTVQELATHQSGLPPFAPGNAFPVIGKILIKGDPHGFRNVDQAIDDALTSPLNERGQHEYSNLAIGLLGQLLAISAGTSYPDLVSDRILQPLQMSHSYATETRADLRPEASKGFDISGHRQDPWVMGGLAPAGSMHSTPADLTTYVQAMIDGTAPGAQAAAKGLADTDRPESSMGLCWIVNTPTDGPHITWHNGMSGGYASFCGWLPETGRGVVVLTNTASSLDGLALDLLTEKVTA